MKTFSQRVVEIALEIPKGKVTTYKEIAGVLGMKGYQAIGQVLKKNPYAPIAPCHRVVKNDGSFGGFKGGLVGEEISEKALLLKKECVEITENKLDLQRFGFSFS